MAYLIEPARIDLAKQKKPAATAKPARPQTPKPGLLALAAHPNLAAVYSKVQQLLVLGNWQVSAVDTEAQTQVQGSQKAASRSSAKMPAVSPPPPAPQKPEKPTLGQRIKTALVTNFKKNVLPSLITVSGSIGIFLFTPTQSTINYHLFFITNLLRPATMPLALATAALSYAMIGLGLGLLTTGILKLFGRSTNQIAKRIKSGYGDNFPALLNSRKDLVALKEMKPTSTTKALITQLTPIVEYYERALDLRFTVECSFNGENKVNTEILVTLGNPHGDLIPQGKLLGKGTYAEVYEGVAISQDGTERPVAIKAIKLGATTDIDKRAIDEGHAMSAIKHPNVMRIHGQSKTEMGRPILVLELMKQTLKDEATGGQTGPDGEPIYRPVSGQKRFANEMIGVLSAAQEMHDQGVFHRDLKPGNLFRDTEGALKIGDFGMARITSKHLKQKTSQITFLIAGAGAAVGTDNFIGPEYSLMSLFNQIEITDPSSGKLKIVQKLTGQEHDKWQAKNDVFAFGVICYLMCTGHYPYEFGYKQYFANPETHAQRILDAAASDASVKEVIIDIIHQSQRVYEESVLAKRRKDGEDTVVVLRRGLDKPLYDIICRATAYNPEDRYASVAEMKLELQAYVDGVGSSRAFRSGAPNPPPPQKSPAIQAIDTFFAWKKEAVIGTLKSWIELDIDTSDLPFQVSAKTQDAFEDHLEILRRSDRTDQELARLIVAIREYFNAEKE